MSERTTSVNDFDIHYDEDEVQIAKATVIDIVHDFTERDGIYSISQTCIDDLRCIVSYEDDSTIQYAENCKIVELETAVSSFNGGALLDALSRAHSWKEKVNNKLLT